MSLRAFHLLFIALSIVLAAFVAAWAVGSTASVIDAGYVAAARRARSRAPSGSGVYGAAFQRKTKR